ncbi:hypothetical protein, partial [Nonomuraea wenchangensis]|uniref:hypothetical protein n=1 Tax=Nonomuraea wenchangensis TaxID=568860 RepID=UPI00332C602F
LHLFNNTLSLLDALPLWLLAVGGGEHDPAAVTLPPAILPGARVDSAFVFDLATYRRPVKLTATMLENGKQIEVAL